MNELNNKLNSLNLILETIDNKFKLNQLYFKVQNLEKDINELKSQVNKIIEKIAEIKKDLNKNNDLENCANIGGLISAITSWIPYIGTLVSIVSGTSAAICTIANS